MDAEMAEHRRIGLEHLHAMAVRRIKGRIDSRPGAEIEDLARRRQDRARQAMETRARADVAGRGRDEGVICLADMNRSRARDRLGGGGTGRWVEDDASPARPRMTWRRSTVNSRNRAFRSNLSAAR
jgi:hypothetical protein